MRIRRVGMVMTAVLTLGLVMAPAVPAQPATPCLVVTGSLTLGADIQCNVGDGIVIAADDVVLNGNGHVLRGMGTGAAVVIEGRTNVLVKNLTLGGQNSGSWGVGVRVEDSHRVRVRNSDLGFVWAIKAVIDNSRVVLFKNNEFGSSGGSGVRITDSKRVRMIGNNLSGADSGIELHNSKNNLIKLNTIEHTFFPGVYLDNTTETLVRRNTTLSADFQANATSTNNRFVRNTLGEFSGMQDDSTGIGTAGTANTYRNNTCADGSEPVGLCTVP